jgi:Dyp-type peroxidase family
MGTVTRDDLDRFDQLMLEGGAAFNPYAANRLLFQWLASDESRASLYRLLFDEHRAVTTFQSEARVEPQPGQNRTVFHTTAHLLTDRRDIERILAERGDPVAFSNEPYSTLGSGTFMLGLDNGRPHQDQRDFAIKAFEGINGRLLAGLIAKALEVAMVLPFKQADFDLASFAEQAALRFAGLLYGLLPRDHPLLEVGMARAYLALDYQILGRHFVSQPDVPEAAKGGALVTRVAELIDQYQSPERPEEVESFLKELSAVGFEPVLLRMAKTASPLSGNERAVVALGSIAGIIGNIQAAVCIAVNEFFEGRRIADACALAQVSDWKKGGDPAELQRWVLEALRLNPPAAFLPRTAMQDVTLPSGHQLRTGDICILAMGSATRQVQDAGRRDHRDWADDFDPRRPPDPLVFGGDGNVHDCFGRYLAQPLITEIVREVLILPELDRTNDVVTGETRGLEKTWGFRCDRFPLRFRRDLRLLQQPLNVIMRVKAPVSLHAEALKAIIRYGAPQIERRLRDARHVHFSWFVFLENDTKLALFTTFDRDFDSYIEHFALQIGDLFDKLFEHLDDAPPLPVAKFPKEFVQTIRRYNVAPVGGYIFSAYPQRDVNSIAPQAGSPPTQPPSPPALASTLPPKPRDGPPAAAARAPSGPLAQASPPIHVEDAQIQRLVVLGFKSQCVRHLVLGIDPQRVELAARWLQAVADRITVAMPKDVEAAVSQKDSDPDAIRHVSLGLTHRALQKLRVHSRYMNVLADKAPAFVDGAYHRAARTLSDTGASSFEAWDSQFKPERADILVSIHAAAEAALDAEVAALRQADGAQALYGWDDPMDGAHLTDTPDSREVHFGFKDGLSTISIDGIHEPRPPELRHKAGEFLLGHVNDELFNAWLLADKEARVGEFFRNGSFCAFRRIEQAVDDFDKFVGKAASALPSTIGNRREYILAKMSGRWLNGQVVQPAQTSAPPPAAGVPDNGFDFSADPAGTGCPFGAHIRRMNPRHDPVVPFRKRPLIRRGMPYGKRHGTPADGRGLLGMFFCASLEDQFEHLVGEWGNRNPMGTPIRGNARDPLFGNHAAHDGSVFDIPTPDGASLTLGNFTPFVRTRGTLYAFYPTVKTLRTIADEWAASAAEQSTPGAVVPA